MPVPLDEPGTARQAPRSAAPKTAPRRVLRAVAHSARHRGDAGQAFPVYITAVAGLLFLALAYFAVGQAGATRNEGQTAADAAALAAAQSHRDQLRTALLRTVQQGGDWEDLILGRGVEAGSACRDAASFAARNDADLTAAGCRPGYLPTSFTVTVRTRDTVGTSVIPGTEDKHAVATAKAVVEPRCEADPATPLPVPDPTPSRAGRPGGPADADPKEPQGSKDPKDPGDPKDPEDPEDPKGKDPVPSLGLDCDGRSLTIDPAHPELFPEAKELFSVRLAE